jgi:multicomponent Na+:H+ antiporter subunit D
MALLIATYDLTRDRLPRGVVSTAERLSSPVANALQALHSGLIGDYVTWIVVGLGLFALTFALS